MKKTFNWLGWLLIALYLIILTALIVAAVIVREPTKGLLYFIAMIWGCFLSVLFPITYFSTLRYLLPLKKEHAKLLVKAWQKQSVWGDGYPLEYKVPILIFEVDNRYWKAFRVSFKLFKSFQGSETGTLIYKEDGGRLFL